MLRDSIHFLLYLEAHGRLKLRDTGAELLEIEYLEDDSIKAAAEVYGDGALDVLVNCAGMAGSYQRWFTRAILRQRHCMLVPLSWQTP